MTPFPCRLGSHAELLGRMIRACGIDPMCLSHDHPDLSFLIVARACMACGHVENCRRWLDEAGCRDLQAPPAFCPNAARFRLARAG